MLKKRLIPKLLLRFRGEKKIPIFIGQHGNNYFTTIYSKHHRELNRPYKFISWGVSNEKKNIFAGFNFNTCGKVIDYNPQGKLLIVTQAVGVSISPFERNLKNEKKLDSNQLYKVIDELIEKPEILEKMSKANKEIVVNNSSEKIRSIIDDLLSNREL